MMASLRVLLVEDTATDAKLLVSSLAKGVRTVEYERVGDAAAMRAALE